MDSVMFIILNKLFRTDGGVNYHPILNENIFQKEFKEEDFLIQKKDETVIDKRLLFDGKNLEETIEIVDGLKNLLNQYKDGHLRQPNLGGLREYFRDHCMSRANQLDQQWWIPEEKSSLGFFENILDLLNVKNYRFSKKTRYLFNSDEPENQYFEINNFGELEIYDQKKQILQDTSNKLVINDVHHDFLINIIKKIFVSKSDNFNFDHTSGNFGMSITDFLKHRTDIKFSEENEFIFFDEEKYEKITTAEGLQFIDKYSHEKGTIDDFDDILSYNRKIDTFEIDDAGLLIFGIERQCLEDIADIIFGQEKSQIKSYFGKFINHNNILKFPVYPDEQIIFNEGTDRQKTIYLTGIIIHDGANHYMTIFKNFTSMDWYLYNDLGPSTIKIGNYEKMLQYKNGTAKKLGTMYFYG